MHGARERKRQSERANENEKERVIDNLKLVYFRCVATKFTANKHKNV